MINRRDHSGEIIGELTCISKSNEKSTSGNYKYLYLCSCGNKRIEFRCNLLQVLKRGRKVSCGCVVNSRSQAKDITGVKRNKLTAIRSTGIKSGNGDFVWVFSCDCGNTCETTIGRFNSNHTKSCGCAMKDSAKLKENYHGLQNTKAYKSWCKIKERCFHENCKDYTRYGAKGITMSSEFRESFKVFYDYVGEAPKDGKRYSIDRIDNTGNYERGNIKWSTYHQQARNKGMQDNNKSGIKGVQWDNKKYKGIDNIYAKATWYTVEGKYQSKSFSLKVYGEELALFLAQEYRTTMMERLNMLGAGYSYQHIYGEVTKC